MCECQTRIERQLLERFKEQAPEATGHTVSLTGYAFIFGKTVTIKGCMPLKQTAEFPLKKGGMKQREVKTSVMFTYCPFCAAKYDAETVPK